MPVVWVEMYALESTKSKTKLTTSALPFKLLVEYNMTGVRII